MKKFIFTYPIRLDDLDYMGIVGNSEWITILTRARIDLLAQIDFPFTKMMKQKIGGVVADLNVKFKKPAFFGDHVNVEIIPCNPFKKGLFLSHLITNQNNEECLSAEIKIMFVDANGIPTGMPEEIAQQLFDLSTEDLS